VPYDFSWAVQRFLRHFRPRTLIILETELWPNIIYFTARKNIPIILANARISQQTFQSYRRAKFMIKGVLNSLTKVAAQSKLDGERFLALGLLPEKLFIAGNIKFDINLPNDIVPRAKEMAAALKLDLSRPIWIAASTHCGEEEQVLKAAQKVWAILPDALLILVPRHPERFPEVFALCRQMGLKTARYSEAAAVGDSVKVFLGDTVGKLLQFYVLAQVAFVGGSLVPTGGHNLLEPAALGLPIIAGHHLDNFRDISQLLLAAKAATIVDNQEGLAREVLQFLQDQKLRQIMGDAARLVVEQNSGAVKKILALINYR
jgi:3-deoxy-D-manno-octulosonic-acid transferase